MKRSLLVAASSAVLALSACNLVSSPSGGGAGEAAAVQIDPAALQAAVQDPRVRAFYEARQWRAVWTDEAARSFEEALADAKNHALDRDTYLGRVNQAGDGAAKEAARTLAALDYAEALARGATDPKRIFEVYEVPRPEGNVAQGLTQAIEGGNLRQYFAGLAPQDAEYRALSQAFVQYHDMAQPAQPRPRQAGMVPSGGNQAQGNTAQPQQPVSDEQRAEALQRARQLAVNLERRRWLQREAPATRIDVNLPAAMLTYVREGQMADRRRVVVGEPGNETPELQSPMFRLVANPTWTVPEGIAAEEILPKGAGYLRRNNMTMRDGMVVQEPGPKNSLGLVKFDMRNDHAIYLHDTPAKALFGQDERYRSHGCVRVQDALGFANMLAQHNGIQQQFQQARGTNEQTFVNLPNQFPVRLLYHTVAVENGRVVFLPDPYDWDERVAVALGREARNQPPAPRPRPPRDENDVGP